MDSINQENWFMTEIVKPKDMDKIEFITKGLKTIERGFFIESEDMFFGSFEDETDNFFFSDSVEFWRPLSE